jgi:anti-sigma B factor antagonist
MVQVSRESDVTVIELGPSYESLDDDALEEMGGLVLTAASTSNPPRLVLDLSQTTFFGSMFIELLVRAWKRLSERDGTMALCGLQPFCAEVIRVTRLDTLWDTYATRGEAVAALAGQ